MAFRNAQQSRVYVGILSAAAYARSVDVNSSTGMLDTTTLADTARAFITDIEEAGTFSLSGPLDVDGTSNGQYDAIADVKAATTPTPITFLPLGTDGAAWLIKGNETDIQLSNAVGQTADYTMSAQTHGQHDYRGVVLENNTSVTADTDGSSVDNGAATSNGAVAHLHVTAYSGFTSDAIIIEGSATGAFAGEETTIVTFTTVTGLTSERVEVTGTVPRYLRVVDDVTGTGSITRFVAISRR